jgi:hypothetical protein
MSAHSRDNSVHQLMDILDLIKPIMKELAQIVGESRKLESRFSEQLHYVAMVFKIDGNIKEELSAQQLEETVLNLCACFKHLEGVLKDITLDREASQLYLKAGVLNKFQQISQRMSACLPL